MINYNTTLRDGQPHTFTITANTASLTFTTARSYQGCR